MSMSIGEFRDYEELLRQQLRETKTVKEALSIALEGMRKCEEHWDYEAAHGLADRLLLWTLQACVHRDAGHREIAVQIAVAYGAIEKW